MKKAIIITLFALLAALQLYGDYENDVIGVVDTVIEEEEGTISSSDSSASSDANWMMRLLLRVWALLSEYWLVVLAFLFVWAFSSAIADILESQDKKYEKMLDVIFLKCTKVVRQNPAYDELRLNENYEKMIKKTLVRCTKKLRRNPTDTEAYYIRALMYAVQGFYNEAIADCSEAILLNPSLPRVYLIRGISYCGKSNYDRAITDFETALEINPNDENVDVKLLIEEVKKLNENQ
jgi:tetratricopeptide (TPR) repeat protein